MTRWAGRSVKRPEHGKHGICVLNWSRMGNVAFSLTRETLIFPCALAAHRETLRFRGSAGWGFRLKERRSVERPEPRKEGLRKNIKFMYKSFKELTFLGPGAPRGSMTQ